MGNGHLLVHFFSSVGHSVLNFWFCYFGFIANAHFLVTVAIGYTCTRQQCYLTAMVFFGGHTVFVQISFGANFISVNNKCRK